MGKSARQSQAVNNKFDSTTGKADTSTAEAGTDDTQWMSPLGTKSSIASDVNIVREQAYQKLVDNAVVHLKFDTDEGHQHNDLSVTRGNATSLIDYTCSTTATGQTADGRIVEVAPDTPRIVWNNGKAVGLLNEPSSENLWLWSEDLSQLPTVRMQINAGTLSAGDITLQEIESTGAGAVYTVQQLVSENGRYSFTLHASAIDSSEVYVRVDNLNRIFDITDETQVDGPSVDNLVFEKLINGVVKVSFSVDVQNGAQDTQTGFFATSAGERICFGALQAEVGYPTSYIPTTTSSAVRGAASSFSQAKIGENEGCIFVQYNKPLGGSFGVVAGFGLDNNEQITIGNGFDGSTRLDVRSAGITQTIDTSNDVTAGEECKALATYSKQADSSYLWEFFFNGLKSSETITTPSLPQGFTSEGVSIGRRRPNSNSLYANAEVSMVSVGNTSFTDAEAIALTTLGS